MFGFLTPGLGSKDNVGGGEPWTYLRSKSMEENAGRANSENRTEIKPIVGLTKVLPKNVLESIVVEAMLRHRFLRDVAELRLAELRDEARGRDAFDSARLAYIRAMIECYAQQACLSTLLDVLGYVPEIGRIDDVDLK